MTAQIIDFAERKAERAKRKDDEFLASLIAVQTAMGKASLLSAVMWAHFPFWPGGIDDLDLS